MDMQGSKFVQDAVADAKDRRGQAGQQERERGGAMLAEVQSEDQAPITEPQFDLDAPVSAYAEAATNTLAEFDRVQALADRESIDAYIEQEMDAIRARHTIDDVVVASEEAFARVESAKRERLERIRRQRAQGLLDVVPSLLRAIDLKIEAQRTLPNGSLEPTRRTLELSERNELRLRYNGRPLAELVTLYRLSSDRDRDIVAFIEGEASADWPTLTPSTGAPADQKAFIALRTLMTERREARVDPKLKDTRARLATVLDIVPTLILRTAAGRL